MYLKKVMYKNVGPLDSISIEMPFRSNGSPKPLILVGENGSGKTTFLSNIIDSLYEMAGVAFQDVRQPEHQNGYQYYKVISSDQIKIGCDYLFSYIAYDSSDEYLFKCGNLSFEDFCQKTGVASPGLNWKESVNYKHTTATKEKIEEAFGKNVFCVFGADRYEKPAWMGDKYYSHDSERANHPSVAPKYRGRIPNPIEVKNVLNTNLQWILDVIVDSRTDIEAGITPNGVSSFILPQNLNPANVVLLSSARKQIEQILSKILRKDIYFGLNYRNEGKSRFNIRSRETDKIVVPTLDSLSTGEIALFNSFSTIIRYADKINMINSANLNDISGIVIIDEIELHLHSLLQREVLPNLIKLFPKIQFVITTHSPLFLLGMRSVLGDDGFEIFQLPDGHKISAESFTEFQRAFDYMINTERFQEEVSKAIQDNSSSKTLIITEGATDWRHIKAAIHALSQIESTKELCENLDIEFLEFDPKNSSDSDSLIKLEMGNTTLSRMCEEYAKIKQQRKLIFIADCDDKDTNKKLGGDGPYKNWGNNVYSIILPIPEHRKTTPDICIEHYYSDDEIKTPVEIRIFNIGG